MRRAIWIALMMAAVVPGRANAQAASLRQGAARAALLAEPARLPEPTLAEVENNARGALIGFVIGAGLGAAAGYGAYNNLCEAVDNQCDGSRPAWMIVSGLALGGIGALLGVLID